MILEKGEGIKTTITPRLIPLLVALTLIGMLWFILFVAYGIIRDVVRKTVDTMRDRNILFSRDGLRVGVRGFGSEQDYKDFAESLLMAVWSRTSESLPVHRRPKHALFHERSQRHIRMYMHMHMRLESQYKAVIVDTEEDIQIDSNDGGTRSVVDNGHASIQVI